MKLLIEVELRFGGRSGVEARSPDLRLTSHGVDEKEALESLRHGIVAWCEGLQLLGRLEQVLKQKGMNWQTDAGSIVVELQPVATQD